MPTYLNKIQNVTKNSDLVKLKSPDFLCCHMPRPLDLPNDILGRVQIMKLPWHSCRRTHFNIILPPPVWSSDWLFSKASLNKSPINILSAAIQLWSAIGSSMIYQQYSVTTYLFMCSSLSYFFSATKSTQRRMKGWIGKDLEGRCRSLIWRYHPGFLLEGLRKTTKKSQSG
jgi:hypothetical protein